ncbi:MAG: hypothetical protein U0235_25870 [Polyangiaceae bacterium]
MRREPRREDALSGRVLARRVEVTAARHVDVDRVVCGACAGYLEGRGGPEGDERLGEARERSPHARGLDDPNAKSPVRARAAAMVIPGRTPSAKAAPHTSSMRVPP